MPDRNIIYTKDGSHTVYSSKFDSLYHSSYGAIVESQHIFIESGLRYFTEKYNQNPIKILEYGFGTGLNALLSMDFVANKNFKLEYTGLEAYPLNIDVVSKLNYLHKTNLLPFKNEFLSMHNNDNILNLKLNGNFIFNKLKIKFEQFDSKDKFDIIYYDVFGAEIQPGFWLRPHLDKVIDNLSQNGILITYGAKGSFKRALKSLGMEVRSLPGPPGKREITRAVKH